MRLKKRRGPTRPLVRTTMRLFLYSLLVGLAGSAIGVICASSLPWMIQATINPAFYILLAYTLPIEPQVTLGSILDITFNTLFFGMLGATYAAKGHALGRVLFYLLFGLYLLQALGMIFFGVVDILGYSVWSLVL